MFEEESMIVSGHDGRLDIDVEMEDLTPRGSAGGYGQPPAAFPGQEVTRSPVMRHSHSSLNSRTGSVYRDPTRTGSFCSCSLTPGVHAFIVLCM